MILRTTFTKKWCFLLKIEKVTTTTEFCILQLVWQISAYTGNSVFFTKLTQKVYFGFKTEEVKTREFWIFKFARIYTKFHFEATIFDFLDQISPKCVFSVKNTEKAQHHRMFHIYISLGTKFQLKLIILFFWTKFAQKGYFQKQKERTALLNSTYSN